MNSERLHRRNLCRSKKPIHWKAVAVFLPLLAALFLVTRYCMPALYTPEWAARHVFWPAALIILLMAALGRIRFSTAALIGYIVGLAAGECFGGFRSAIQPQYLHYGWLILIVLLALSAAAGILWERRRAQIKPPA